MKALYIAAMAVMMNLQTQVDGQKNERVFLSTDRTLYIAGENILFSAFLQPDMNSKVLYCELLRPDGRKIVADKFLVDKSLASGSLMIPSGTITGIYYIRAYTKIMRNEGPASFAYKALKIVNLYRNEVLKDLSDNQTSDNINPGRSSTGSFKIETDRSKVPARDSIHISISEKNKDQILKSIAFSIIPDNSFQNLKVQVKAGKTEEHNFMPESNGVSLSGSVRDKVDGNVIRGIRVNLSVIGAGRDFMAVRTDSSGRFFFSLQGYQGAHDLFLGTEKPQNFQPRIFVDNDFCTIPVQLFSEPFMLSGKERQAAYKMAVNFQVDSAFRKVARTDVKAENENDASFYGTPDETIILDEYVELPTLEEYFNELPTLVKVRKREGQKYFKVLGTQAELMEMDPLVMVDLVAVDDPDKVLAANPKDIEKIEVINSVYVKGDQLYGGIINIISRKGDFAGIDLPSSGLFIRYGFPEGASGNKTISDDPPDARNTLLWIPAPDIKSRKEITLIAPETPGRYDVIISGVTSNGEILSDSASFEVTGKR